MRISGQMIGFMSIKLNTAGFETGDAFMPSLNTIMEKKPITPRSSCRVDRQSRFVHLFDVSALRKNW